MQDELFSQRVLQSGAFTFIVFFIGAVLLAPEVNYGSVDGAAVIALIGGAAVGIERLTETMWVLVGNSRGTWWPMRHRGVHERVRGHPLLRHRQA